MSLIWDVFWLSWFLPCQHHSLHHPLPHSLAQEIDSWIGKYLLGHNITQSKGQFTLENRCKIPSEMTFPNDIQRTTYSLDIILARPLSQTTSCTSCPVQFTWKPHWWDNMRVQYSPLWLLHLLLLLCYLGSSGLWLWFPIFQCTGQVLLPYRIRIPHNRGSSIDVSYPVPVSLYTLSEINKTLSRW